MILVDFRKWFVRHIRFFIKPIPVQEQIESPSAVTVDDTTPNTV
jgi:hypothetical protein